MPIYEFKCEDCKLKDKIERSIKNGPPESLECLICGGTMYQVYNPEILFKGDWPGKTIKQAGDKGAEAFQEAAKQRRSDQELSNAVLAERRKGRENWKKYQKDHPDKVKRYKKNLGNGVKGK